MISLFLSLILSMAHASNTDDARAHAIRAAYIQTGTDEYVTTLVKHIDSEYIPEYIKTNGAVAAVLLQCTITHQIAWKWSF